MVELECDILIVGGGTGACAAAMATCSLGMRVILTSSTRWVGGQLTSQMVPPDEHPWIEEFGCTARYRKFRNDIRQWYRTLNLVTDSSRPDAFMNPGGGWVSRLCFLPRIGEKAIRTSLDSYRPNLTILRCCSPVSAEVEGDKVRFVVVRDSGEGTLRSIRAEYVLDATELGDITKLAEAEYRVGSESHAEFGEPHATEAAEPENVQGFTWCFALSADPRHSIEISRPADYERWRTYQPLGWPGAMLSFTFPNPIDGSPRTLPLFGKFEEDRASLFAYRQIVDRRVSARPSQRDTTVVNWPQNDYFLGSVIDVPDVVANARLEESKALGRSLVYWLQTEAPRQDGGVGYPNVFISNVSGSRDGFAQEPYHRESRRMVTRFTVTEQMVAADCNPGLDRAPAMPKSVGVGHYRIDLHPSADGHGYIDVPSLPFQIPLGALIPVRLRNLLPACKNLGVTHITNGCYRLHPVEWNVGETAGLLAAFCVTRNVEPAAVYENEELWLDFERLLVSQGIETAWPSDVDLTLPN